jgi:glycine cleavage system H protein
MSIQTHHIIPEDERHCIWMDAGVVDYKLCTAGFICETCPFDAQIRTEHRFSTLAVAVPAAANREGEPADGGDRERGGRSAAGGHAPVSRHDADGEQNTAIATSSSADAWYSSLLQQALRSFDLQPLPDDRMYASNHTWAKQDEDGSYVLGIDHFIGTMLTGMHSVACSIVPTHIKAAEPYAWIVANGETLAVRSPIAGTIVAYNPALGDQSSVIHRDPYGSGWISRIIPTAEDRASLLMPAGEFSPRLRRDTERFEKSIRSKFRALQTVPGGTMYDGGAALSSFEDMLGSMKFYAILERFLRLRR